VYQCYVFAVWVLLTADKYKLAVQNLGLKEEYLAQTTFSFSNAPSRELCVKHPLGFRTLCIKAFSKICQNMDLKIAIILRISNPPLLSLHLFSGCLDTSIFQNICCINILVTDIGLLPYWILSNSFRKSNDI
jgi:hypothetical protein